MLKILVSLLLIASAYASTSIEVNASINLPRHSGFFYYHHQERHHNNFDNHYRNHPVIVQEQHQCRPVIVQQVIYERREPVREQPQVIVIIVYPRNENGWTPAPVIPFDQHGR
jgi:hypothetical protein